MYMWYVRRITSDHQPHESPYTSLPDPFRTFYFHTPSISIANVHLYTLYILVPWTGIESLQLGIRLSTQCTVLYTGTYSLTLLADQC